MSVCRSLAPFLQMRAENGCKPFIFSAKAQSSQAEGSAAMRRPQSLNLGSGFRAGMPPTSAQVDTARIRDIGRRWPNLAGVFKSVLEWRGGRFYSCAYLHVPMNTTLCVGSHRGTLDSPSYLADLMETTANLVRNCRKNFSCCLYFVKWDD